MDYLIEGEPLVAGAARGEALAGTEALSFWGGYDAATGEIIDRAHPLSGSIASGRILVLPFSRGSSTGTAVLLEAIRRNTAPAAILVSGRDTFFALASIVAQELYGRSLPVVAIPEASLTGIRTGDDIRLDVNGRIEGTRPT